MDSDKPVWVSIPAEFVFDEDIFFLFAVPFIEGDKASLASVIYFE